MTRGKTDRLCALCQGAPIHSRGGDAKQGRQAQAQRPAQENCGLEILGRRWRDKEVQEFPEGSTGVSCPQQHSNHRREKPSGQQHCVHLQTAPFLASESSEDIKF